MCYFGNYAVRSIARVVVLFALVMTGANAEPQKSQADFYVATSGNDNWSGKLASPNTAKTDGPFRTLPRARDAIRQLKARQPLHKALTVLLRGGTYSLPEPFVLRPEDSGTEKYPITYAAFPGEKPVLSGGKALTGWKRAEGELWTTEVPEVKAGKLYFTQLFINDQRRERARLPKKGYKRCESPTRIETWGGARVFQDYYDKPEPAAPEQQPDTGPGGGTAPLENRRAFRFRLGEIRKDWINLEDVEVVVLQFWTEARLRIAAVDEASQVVTFTGSGFRSLAWSLGYYVENVYEGLDEPGEWYLNRKTGVLTYWPLPGEDMSKAKVIAPATKELVRIEGDVDSGKFVEHVNLHGLTFSYTAWTLPERGYAYWQAEVAAPAPYRKGGAYGRWVTIPEPERTVRVPAAIAVEAALHCSIDQNELIHLGAWGIDLGRGSKDNRIVSNRLEDVGAGGIKVGESTKPKNDVEAVTGTLVSDNTLAGGCRVYLGAPGIWVGQSSGNRVAHNEISGGWEFGISVGWSWEDMLSTYTRDNIVEYNHLHHVGESALGTDGAIYTCGVSPGTVIRNNLIHDFSGGSPGIILDNTSSAILVENNIVNHMDGAGLMITATDWPGGNVGNVIQNNIFALGRTHQLVRYGDPPPPGALPVTSILHRNIIYFKEGSLYREKKWADFYICQDYNLYYDASGRPVKFLTYNFDEWKTKGLDQHSLIADPLFVDPEKGDFTMKADSPAFKLGFKPIDVSRVGPRRAKGRSLPRP